MDNVFLNILIYFIFFSFGLYTLYSLFLLIKTLINYVKNKHSKLEIEILIKSLASSMIILICIHLLQMLLSTIFNRYYPNVLYTPIISSGDSKGLNINNSSLHIESSYFDFFIITLVYNINRLKNNLISKKQFLRPIIYTAVLSILFTFVVSIVWIGN